MGRVRHCFLLLAIGWGYAQTAWSIEIFDLASKRRVVGFLVQEDASKLRIRVSTGGDKTKLFDFDRVKIKIISQLDRERLQKLSREKPDDYRKYAQELAEKTGDPEAKATAMRLFLIAAYLEPQRLGPGCLLNMSELAPPAEARKYQALAFLLDNHKSAKALKRASVKPVVKEKAQQKAFADFQAALRFYRIGQLTKAKELAGRDGVDRYFAMAPGMMDQKSFLHACDDAGCTTCRSKKWVPCTTCGGMGVTRNQFGAPVICPACIKGHIWCKECDGTGVNQTFPEDKLRLIISAELWAISDGNTDSQQGTGETRWSKILQGGNITSVPILTLETISDIDPRQCIFRNGNWTAP